MNSPIRFLVHSSVFTVLGSTRQRATSNEQQATSNEQQATSNEQQATSNTIQIRQHVGEFSFLRESTTPKYLPLCQYLYDQLFLEFLVPGRLTILMDLSFAQIPILSMPSKLNLPCSDYFHQLSLIAD